MKAKTCAERVSLTHEKLLIFFAIQLGSSKLEKQ